MNRIKKMTTQASKEDFGILSLGMEVTWKVQSIGMASYTMKNVFFTCWDSRVLFDCPLAPWRLLRGSLSSRCKMKCCFLLTITAFHKSDDIEVSEIIFSVNARAYPFWVRVIVVLKILLRYIALDSRYLLKNEMITNFEFTTRSWPSIHLIRACYGNTLKAFFVSIFGIIFLSLPACLLNTNFLAGFDQCKEIHFWRHKIKRTSLITPLPPPSFSENHMAIVSISCSKRPV